MPVHLLPPVAAALHPISGVRIGVTKAGIRKADRKDLTVVLIDEGASVSGVFTQNRFVQRRCKCVVSTWLQVRVFALCSSTPAMPTQAQGNPG